MAVTKRKRKSKKPKKMTKAKLRRKDRGRARGRLRRWAARILAAGKCAVCAIGVVQKVKDGKPVFGKKSKRLILIHLHAHHLLPKERYPEYRFKKVNGVCLCPTHHKYGRHSAHRNPIWFALWLRANRPEQYAWCLAHVGDWCDSITTKGSNAQKSVL